ncbi:hypothetical protein CQ064_10445 [Bacillus sp. MYb78]|nr:hypothetical protein bthur0002_61990 [Bacillus thuringiensis Bt407]PQZ78222.1 hypothetical protein CQ064_10445 [Bacillus sp. MYb78]
MPFCKFIKNNKEVNRMGTLDAPLMILNKHLECIKEDIENYKKQARENPTSTEIIQNLLIPKNELNSKKVEFAIRILETFEPKEDNSDKYPFFKGDSVLNKRSGKTHVIESYVGNGQFKSKNGSTLHMKNLEKIS